MTNSIEVINLSKKYKDKVAVTNINFKINENEMIGLLGPNGCGKTTTIGMILGLLKPSSCLLYTSPSPRDMRRSRMPSSA